MVGNGHFIIVIGSEPGPEIPYPPEVRPNGLINYGFMDLRDRHSEAVPEADSYPSLARLLDRLNNGERRLLTLGCEVGFFPATSADGGEISQLGFYIDFAFRDASLNSKYNMTSLAEYLRKARLSEPFIEIYAELTVEEMPVFFGISGCFNISIKMCFYSKNGFGGAKIRFDAECSLIIDPIEFAASKVASKSNPGATKQILQK